MRRHAIALLLAVIALSCGPSQQIELPAGSWNLTRLTGENATAFKRPVTLTIDTTQNRVTGFAGCNQYFSNYTVKRSAIRFSGTGSTKMFCEDAMNIENKYLETLGYVRSFRIEDNRLLLMKGDSVLLEFVGNP